MKNQDIPMPQWYQAVYACSYAISHWQTEKRLDMASAAAAAETSVVEVL